MTKILEFKNAELQPVGNFLATLKLAGKASRGRSELIRRVAKKIDEFNEDYKETREPYFVKDKNEKLVVKDEKYVYKDPSKKEELEKELNDLSLEKAVIEFTEYPQKFQALYRALDNYEGTFSQGDAIIYDLLMDQFEQNYEKAGK